MDKNNKTPYVSFSPPASSSFQMPFQQWLRETGYSFLTQLAGIVALHQYFPIHSEYPHPPTHTRFKTKSLRDRHSLSLNVSCETQSLPDFALPGSHQSIAFLKKFFTILYMTALSLCFYFVSCGISSSFSFDLPPCRVIYDR